MKIKEIYIEEKIKNAPKVLCPEDVYALIERVANKKYAEAVILEKCEDDGFDFYEVSNSDGKILIRASTGVGFAAGFNAYLKEICGYSVGIMTNSGTLPDTPPTVDKVISAKSGFLYRYFFNYCTFSYTYAFDMWEEWEKTIDYLLLSGYNLVLNPIGLESVWRSTLISLGYTKKEADGFLCGPAFYAWQWMMNMSGWAGGAPEWWYSDRVSLAEKINKRLHAFGVSTVIPGYIGMVPHDFGARFPEAKIIPQGRWGGFNRPAMLMPNDPLFDKVADTFYTEYKKIAGFEGSHYFSGDPFHEGGVTDGIDLADYAKRVYKKMQEVDTDAVWVFQGWTDNPKTEILRQIPDGRVLITNLLADKAGEEELYGGAPWCYCSVHNFGGQNAIRGNVERFLRAPHAFLKSEHANMIGIGYMPEAVCCTEILFEVAAYNAFHGECELREFIAYYIKTRYGYSSDALTEALVSFCREVLDGEQRVGGESALCARPTLTVRNTSLWARKPNPYMEQAPLIDYITALISEYDNLKSSAAYRKDLVEAARQAVANLSWYFVAKIQESFQNKELDAVSHYGNELLSLFDLQEKIVSTDKEMLLGTWLEKAKRHGKTPAEKAYFEWNARVQITLWANREGSVQLRDYAAKEWSGMLEDFYRPRWESFISRLEISLLTDTPLEEINYYDEELPFVYRKKEYPTEPHGNLKAAALAAIKKISGAQVEHKADTEKQLSFEENVMKTITK